MRQRLGPSIVGAAVCGSIGWWAASLASPRVSHSLAAVVGVFIGLVIIPTVAMVPLRRFDHFIASASTGSLLGGGIGLLLGLAVAGLITLPLALFGPPFNRVVPMALALVLGTFGAHLGARRGVEIDGAWSPDLSSKFADAGEEGTRSPALLDTSAIIDGRIADIYTTGFIRGDLAVPRFILEELQHIADSPDALRRNRGRRGLDLLQKIGGEGTASVQILTFTGDQIDATQETDAKLVMVARLIGAPIVTTDWNLNKIAQLEGVRVLNVNELANAVKPVALPNEEMSVHILQPGREREQGVAYLDDGTMIVVEDGAHHLDKTVDVIITRSLQTAAGRMIFASLKGESPPQETRHGQ